MMTYRQYMDMTPDEALRQSAADDAEWARRIRMQERKAAAYSKLRNAFLLNRPFAITTNLAQLSLFVAGAVVIWSFTVGF
jgi:hypothetical protein